MNKIVFLLFFFFFFNFNVFADVKDDIAKINDLKETGLLTDQDYKNLLEKSIIQTEEYKKIKGLFDSEIINLEEFENFINKIIIKYSIGDILTEDSSAAKEAADKAAKEAADKAEVTRKEIGKVLKVANGKAFGDDKKLKKKYIVETGVLYKTIAGGDLHLMLDEKTRIFIGYESEIIINKFDVVDKKVHEVEIELISGSFLYLSLRKTSTDLKVLIDDNILTSKGYETSVAFLKNEKEIRFVNAGKSSLTYEDQLLSFAQYAILEPLSKSISINSITNAKGDKLIGTALEDFSMTVMGVPVSDSSGGEGTPAATGGGCG